MSINDFVLILNNASLSAYLKPKQDLWKSNDQKVGNSFRANGYSNVGEWYAQNVRYISTLYNIPTLNTIYNPGTTNKQITPVDEINENFNYFYGLQTSRPLTPDCDDVDLHQWLNGQKITQIVSYLVGTMQNLIQSAEWTIKNHEKGELTKREMKLQLALLKVKFRDFFAETASQGINFEPIPNMPQDTVTETEVVSFAKTNIFDIAEETALTIITRLQYDTKSAELYIRAFRHCVIGRYCGIWNHVSNGRFVKETVPPQNLVLDFSYNSDRYRKAPHIGVIQFLTPDEIFERWTLTPEERKQVYDLSYSTNYDLWNIFNRPTNYNLGFQWWANNNGKRLVACVTGYWRSFVRPDYKEIDYDEVFLHKGTLIGNKIICDYGADENIVRNPMDLSEIQLPIQVYMPEIDNGIVRSTVDRLRPLQDRYDSLEFVLAKKYSRDNGKVYLIKGHKAYNIDVAEMMKDFKNFGYYVAVHTGEIDDYTNNESLMDVMDFTIDPNLRLYAEMQQKYRQEMEEVQNVSKIALGQQTSYVGAATQNTSIQQSSTSQSGLMQGFLNFMVEDQQYTLEKMKIFAITEEGKEYVSKFLTPKQLKFLKDANGFTMADLRAIAKIEDVIDSQMRQRLLMYAQGWSQNPDIIPPEAIIAVETARTLSKLKSELEMILGNARIQKEKKEAIMMGMQQAAAADANQAQMQIAEGKDATKLQGDQMKSETAVVTKAMDLAGKNNNNQAA